jgi:hypothetical protein
MLLALMLAPANCTLLSALIETAARRRIHNCESAIICALLSGTPHCQTPAACISLLNPQRLHWIGRGSMASNSTPTTRCHPDAKRKDLPLPFGFAKAT